MGCGWWHRSVIESGELRRDRPFDREIRYLIDGQDADIRDDCSELIQLDDF